MNDKSSMTTTKKSRQELEKQMRDLRSHPCQEPFVVILSGQDKGKKYILAASKTTLGRSPKSNIQLYDPRVSVEHCCIRLRQGEYYLEDTNSSNGTWLNGRKINSYKLQNGDRIIMGSTEMVFTIPGQKNAPNW